MGYNQNLGDRTGRTAPAAGEEGACSALGWGSALVLLVALLRSAGPGGVYTMTPACL